MDTIQRHRPQRLAPKPKQGVKTRAAGNRLGEAEVAKVCFHPAIVDLVCSTCGTEFNDVALAEVLEGWEIRVSS